MLSCACSTSKLRGSAGFHTGLERANPCIDERDRVVLRSFDSGENHAAWRLPEERFSGRGRRKERYVMTFVNERAREFKCMHHTAARIDRVRGAAQSASQFMSRSSSSDDERVIVEVP